MKVNKELIVPPTGLPNQGLIKSQGAVQGSGQGLFPSRLCPPLISLGVTA